MSACAMNLVLPSEIKNELVELANRTGSSQASIVKLAIHRYLQRERKDA